MSNVRFAISRIKGLIVRKSYWSPSCFFFPLRLILILLKTISIFKGAYKRGNEIDFEVGIAWTLARNQKAEYGWLAGLAGKTCFAFPFLSFALLTCDLYAHAGLGRLDAYQLSYGIIASSVRGRAGLDGS